MFNRIQLVGFLGNDPELRYTADAKAVCNMRVAAKSGFGDKAETDWFTVTCWEKTAEAANEHLAKGSKVFIDGRLHIREWEDKEGVKRWTAEVTANTVLYLDGKDDAEATHNAPAPTQKKSNPPVRQSQTASRR